MKSPFPGMDPYLEACGLWEDFHQELMGEIKTALNQILPETYSARLGERAYISLVSHEPLETERHSMQGDVTIVSAPSVSRNRSHSASAILESPMTAEQVEPVEMIALIQSEFREPFIEIRSIAPDRPLITTIEVLSPSNKRRGTDGWDLYLRKRNAHLRGAANLVEIDLLRGGQRMPMETEWPNSPYALLVSRKATIPRSMAWPASFAAPLPPIPIPLAHPDPDVMLSLQPMIDAIYTRSRYSRDIDYEKPCLPPFAPAEEKWFRDRLAQLASG